MKTGPENGIEIPDGLKMAICQLADENAKRTAAILQCARMSPDSRPIASFAFLLEVAAISTLIKWEQQGALRQLGEGTPNLEEIKTGFLERCRKGVTAFANPDDTPVANLVFELFLERFAMEAPERLNATFLIAGRLDDGFIDELAEFLWANWHAVGNYQRGVNDDVEAK